MLKNSSQFLFYNKLWLKKIQRSTFGVFAPNCSISSEVRTGSMENSPFRPTRKLSRFGDRKSTNTKSVLVDLRSPNLEALARSKWRIFHRPGSSATSTASEREDEWDKRQPKDQAKLESFNKAEGEE